MNYFESRIKGKKGLPWFDSRTSWEKSSDEYFEKLEALAERLDDIESDTSFISDLSTDDFDSGYQFVCARINELQHYVKYDAVDVDKEDLLESIDEVHSDLLDLETDAILYKDYFDDDEGDNEPDEDIEYDFDDLDDSWDSDDDSDETDDYNW